MNLLFACGICTDHILDGLLPFLRPTLPVVIAFLCVRRLLHLTHKLPDIIPPPRNFFLFFGCFLALLFLSNGSGLMIIAVLWAITLQSIFRVMLNLVKLPDCQRSRQTNVVLLIILIGLGYTIFTTIAWIRSPQRMQYHLSYGGTTGQAYRPYYFKRAAPHQNFLMGELQQACDNGIEKEVLWMANIFYLVRPLGSLKVVPCIKQLLRDPSYHNQTYTEKFLHDGLLTLKALDSSMLNKACLDILASPQLSKHERKQTQQLCASFEDAETL